MRDFVEQYRQELVNQEIKSNKRTLTGFIWFLVAVALIWVLTVAGFFEVDKKLITIAFVSTAVLLLPPLYVLFWGDLSKHWLKYIFLSLVCVASAVIVSFLSYHAVLLYVVPLLFAVQYRRWSTIWFVYVVNTVTMLISSLVSFYYGICDLNLLLQSQHTRSWYLDIITEQALNIPFNDNPVFIIIVFEVFPRSI
ncbi:MAG: GGDEF domain-containing protein, partial [Eubacterium sp.]|nr:GGDEF domain-containing protein [Eubacterium sp.]